jgi:hypothetical protein
MSSINDTVSAFPSKPLAQTFQVPELQGVFITAIDIFFSSKHDTLPVTLSIRPVTSSGVPSTRNIIPGSQVAVASASVNTSTDASSATTFRFDEPIYLKGGRAFAFTISSAAKNAYKCWAATQGDFVLGTTTRRVTRDPVPGSLYKNQTGLAYQPDVASDLKYKMYRAAFDISGVEGTLGGGYAFFTNADPDPKKLTNNPLRATAGDSSVEVIFPHHGFIKDDYVTILGLDSASTFNGVKGSSINGKRVVTWADTRAFKVDMDSVPTSSIRFGGSGIRATRQNQFTTAQLQMDDYAPTSTNIGYRGMLATHGSHADSDLLDQAYSRNHITAFKNNEDVDFDKPHVIATRDNEFHKLADSESFAIIGGLVKNENNDRVAPFINLENAQFLTTMNIIDFQSDSNWSGFNIPINFVAETHPSGGSAAAKHITKPVQLALGATGLKVILAANRPPDTDFELYFRTSITGGDSDLGQINWIEQAKDFDVRTDENPDVFREYRFTIGDNGDGFAKALPEFDRYQLKIVMKSKNPAIVPRITDLRTIALGNDD